MHLFYLNNNIFQIYSNCLESVHCQICIYSVKKYKHGSNMASCGTSDIHLVRMYEIETVIDDKYIKMVI